MTACGLTAILVADVAGSSALIGAEEVHGI